MLKFVFNLYFYIKLITKLISWQEQKLGQVDQGKPHYPTPQIPPKLALWLAVGVVL